MPEQYYTVPGVNTYLNPIATDGLMIHGVNVTSFPYGAKSKRQGYTTFLGTVAGTVQQLWQFASGTQQYLYMKAGSLIYYSTQGTGAWTICGNGTVDPNAYIGNAVYDTTMIIGDAVGSTRHTTIGSATTFTNTSLAPLSNSFEIFQGRAYAAGTASDLFYSVSNDITNWQTSGTSDSSSFKIPGAGKLGKIFKSSDRLIIPKTSGLMFKWDGYSLIDMATQYGPNDKSMQSIAKAEDYPFYINNFGHYGFPGSKPQLLSNAIQRQFYNQANTGISGTIQKVGVVHIYDYLASVGSFTDDFTSRTITNGIIKYDFQKNEYLNWDLANRPSAMLSYRDRNGDQQLIFGDSGGQCYQFGTATSDNGTAINISLAFVFTFKVPEYDKKWNWLRMFFNPGCQARVQIAWSDAYTYEHLNWVDIGDVTDGEVEYRFPADARSRLLFIRIEDASRNSQSTYYGCSLDADVQVQR